MIEAKYRERGNIRSEVYLLDLSANGCKVETSLRLAPGDIVSLKLDGLESRQARVRWSDQGAMGCEFLEPLALPVVSHLVEKHPFLNESNQTKPL